MLQHIREKLSVACKFRFQWAPTLGGECYNRLEAIQRLKEEGFNGHPPLGVNATKKRLCKPKVRCAFQWAPTLGGECYLSQQTPTTWASEFQWAPTLGGECYIEETA